MFFVRTQCINLKHRIIQINFNDTPKKCIKKKKMNLFNGKKLAIYVQLYFECQVIHLKEKFKRGTLR